MRGFLSLPQLIKNEAVYQRLTINLLATRAFRALITSELTAVYRLYIWTVQCIFNKTSYVCPIFQDLQGVQILQNLTLITINKCSSANTNRKDPALMTEQNGYKTNNYTLACHEQSDSDGE